MRRSHIEQESVASAVNLTPLIDMVFILLIFFVVTSSFVKESGIEVNRPTAETAVRKEQGNIIIAVSKDGEIWMDKHQIDLRAVRPEVERLHAENPEGAVVIVADELSRSGLMVKVMDQVRLAGIMNVSIAAATENAGP